MSTSQDPYRIGIEEEFQIVNAKTLELEPRYNDIMRHIPADLKGDMKPEFLQCVIESITGICNTVEEAVMQTLVRRATILKAAKCEGLTIVSAGTHPTSYWYDQTRTNADRYSNLENVLQDVARSILIYGLHVHVEILDDARRVAVMNQARNFLPYILALSANSPFWMGRNTGFMSYRMMVWSSFPLNGIPDSFDTLDDFLAYESLLKQTHTIDETRRVWWDIRLHHSLPTLEFRIADMPIHHQDMIGLVAFIQALVKTINDHIESGDPFPIVPTAIITENRWRAARWGIHGKFIDYVNRVERTAIEMIGKALDIVGTSAHELGTSKYLLPLHQLIHKETMCGADLQRAIFQKLGKPQLVTAALIRETARGIDQKLAL